MIQFELTLVIVHSPGKVPAHIGLIPSLSLDISLPLCSIHDLHAADSHLPDRHVSQLHVVGEMELLCLGEGIDDPFFSRHRAEAAIPDPIAHGL